MTDFGNGYNFEPFKEELARVGLAIFISCISSLYVNDKGYKINHPIIIIYSC